MTRRILFVSFASYLDDANGASVASRAMMETLSRLGFGVEVLCGPIRELGREIDLAPTLAGQGLTVEVHGGDTRDVGSFRTRSAAPDHATLQLNGVPVTILAGSALPRAPDDEACRAFLRLFEQVWARFRPEVVVSYGGGWLTREILRRAKARGAATVFPLHNLRYGDLTTFVDVDAVLVASQFAAEHYRKTLGLRCTVLPNLVDFERVRALDRRPTFVVFVNPTIEKGVGVFARIADALGQRRPDIPFLVVEAKGTEADVAACGLDLRAHGNVFFHEHTNDPRRFWRLAKVCILPSLIAENQPLVAVEAMINGVPVLGSDRGGIPETIGRGGSILPIPDRLTPRSQSLPTPEESTPWVEAILEIWDSPEVHESFHRRTTFEAQRWLPAILEPRYEQFFTTVGSASRLSSAGAKLV